MKILLLLMHAYVFYPTTDTVLNLHQNDYGVVKFYLENNGSQTESYEVQIITLEKPQDASIQLCLGGLCRPFPYGVDTLAPGEYDTILVEIFTGNDPGNLRFYLLINNEGNPQDRDSTFIIGAVTSISENIEISNTFSKILLQGEILQIDLNKIKPPVEYQIASPLGVVIKNGILYRTYNFLNMSQLKPGIYFITLHKNKQIFSYKLIKWR